MVGVQNSSELDLANGFRVVADGHAEEPDVYHLCQTLAQQCEEHAEQLEPFVHRYGEEKPEVPDRLYHELFDEVRQGSLGLLRDLQDLYVMAQFCDITWTMIGQAAQGARDRELFEVVETCEEQTATQVKWLKTRMKQAAPQVLLLAS